MPTILDTIDASLNPKTRIIELINIKEGTNYSVDDYNFGNPEIPSIDNRVRNTRVILTSKVESTLYGSLAVWYNRIHGSTLGVIQVVKGAAVTIYQLIPAINLSAGIQLTEDDVFNATLGPADVNGLITVSLDFKPTSLLFYGGAVLALNSGFTANDRELLDQLAEQNITLSDATPQALATTAAAGTSAEASRSDHKHALPAIATQNASGLMSGQDKTDLNTLKNTTFLQLGTDAPVGLGIANAGSAEAASKEDHVHPLPATATTSNNGLMSSTHVTTLNDLTDDVAALGNTLSGLVGAGVNQVPTNGSLGTAARVDSEDIPQLAVLPSVEVSVNTTAVINTQYDLVSASIVLLMPNPNTLVKGNRFKCTNCSDVSDEITAPAFNFNGAKFQKQIITGNIPLNSKTAIVDLVWSGNDVIGWTK